MPRAIVYLHILYFLLDQSTEHKKNAGQHPGLYGSESLCLGSVGGDVVEDVDQHQE